MQAPEQIVLDGNALAAGHAFYHDRRRTTVSRDGKLVAWAEDTRRAQPVRAAHQEPRDRRDAADTATNIAPSLAWANDNKTLFYGGKDATTLREDRVFRHVLGGSDELVFARTDGSYYVGVGKTKSRPLHRDRAATRRRTPRRGSSTPTSRQRAPRVFLPRAKDHLYDARSPRQPLRRCARTSTRRTSASSRSPPAKRADRKRVAATSSRTAPTRSSRASRVYDDVHRGVGAHRRAAQGPGAADERQAVLHRCQRPGVRDDRASTRPIRRRRACATRTTRCTRRARCTSSTSRPRERTLLKQRAGARRTTPSKYASEYLHATAPRRHAGPDLGRLSQGHAARRHARRSSSTATARTATRSSRTSISDASACSIAAGSTRSRTCAAARRWAAAWYEDGKLLNKRNTFTDFIAVTEYLVAAALRRARQGVREGGSAGGLLDRRGREHAARPLSRHRRVRAVRRRRHDDARRDRSR